MITKESILNSNSLSGSGHLRRFDSPIQGDDPEQEIVNASKRSVPAPEIKADGSSDHSPIRSLRPGRENVKCAMFEIFASRSTIEILIDHYLKASGLTHLTKLNFSYLADQVLTRVPRSHVAHVIDQVITDHLKEPLCRYGRNDRGGGGVVSSDQAGAPSNPSATCLNNELLDAGSDSGYASSFAASNRTGADRLEESVLSSSYLLGPVLPRFEDLSACQTRKKWPEDHSGQSNSNDVDIDLRACSSGFSPVREVSYSTSPGARDSPARSLDSRAVSEGEMSFALSADSDDLLEDWEANLDPELIRIRSHLVQQLVDSYTSTESELHDAIQLSPSGEPSSSSRGSSNHSSSSRSRTTQTSKTSLGKHKMSQDEEDDDVQEEDRPLRRKRTRVTTEPISLDGRLLACPYCKYDPIRYSECNIEEKAYRGCSSSYLSTISRLKQHLYRVHRRPEFYCRSCFQVFQSENQLDIHSRTRPSCLPCESRFAEKMTVEQMSSVKRRKPGKSPADTWFVIFRILFPEAPLPESPYVDSVSVDAIRAFMDHFQRRAQAILWGLIQEQLGSTLVLHSDQQRILDSALESAIAQLVTQVGLASQQVENHQAVLESPDIGIQGDLNRDMGDRLVGDAVEESRICEDSEHVMASTDHDDPHELTTWTPSWEYEGLDDLGDFESVFH